MNILKIQDSLKNLSDEQLAQEMRLPSGTAPQYLVMTEMQRRQKMRDEFSGSQPPKTTMAEEMSGEAPPAPPAGGMPPEGDEANAQGIMGLPDQTMAGGAMRAMISGQPQQVDDMTAMPPQGMAAGGAVQFGSPFANAQMGSAPAPSTGYSPIPQYAPKQYRPEKEPDYASKFKDLFHTERGAPNPRVHRPENERYGLPAGMAIPTYGTPGLVMRDNKNDRVSYHWASPAYRDAYIRYMTPPAKTDTAAAAPTSVPATTTTVTKAGGGPIRLSGGGIFDDWASDESTPEEVYATMRDSDITEMLGKKGPVIETSFGAWGGNPVTLTREGLLAEAKRRNQMNPIERGGKDLLRFAFPYVDTVTAPVKLVPRSFINANEAAYNRAKRYAFGDVPLPEDAYGDTERGHGSGPSKPSDKIAPTGAVAPQKQAAPPAAAVSGAPKKEAAPATDGGLAALLQQKQDRARAYEERANALLDKQRGDKDALANRDFNSALMQLGLGLAGSKANNLMSGIAEAGLPALQQYTAAREGRRKDEGALTDAELAILGKSNEIAQAEDKAAQDAYEAQRRYEIDQRTLDIQQQQADDDARYQDAMAAARGSGGYTKGEIAWANKLEADDRDFVKAQNITDEERRLAKQILFSVRANGGDGGMTGIGPAPDPREAGLVPVN